MWDTSFALVKDKTWFSPDDDRVDIAIIPIQNQRQLDDMVSQDVTELKVSDFSTPEELTKFAVGTGDGILSAGPVPALLDVKRNYPAFKFGKISNVLSEPVKARCENTPALRSRKESRGWCLPIS